MQSRCAFDREFVVPLCRNLGVHHGQLTFHPLLLQASLVAQFLCTIPLVSVETVLAWLKPSVPYSEQQQLCRQVTASYRLLVT